MLYSKESFSIVLQFGIIILISPLLKCRKQIILFFCHIFCILGIKNAPVPIKGQKPKLLRCHPFWRYISPAHLCTNIHTPLITDRVPVDIYSLKGFKPPSQAHWENPVLLRSHHNAMLSVYTRKFLLFLLFGFTLINILLDLLFVNNKLFWLFFIIIANNKN